MARKIQDLTGQRFGRLIVLELDKEKTRYGSTYWKCKCDCGNIKSVNASLLKSGQTQSCGCLHRERTISTHFKDLTGQRFGRLTVISKCDKNDIGKSYSYTCWKCKCDCGNIIITPSRSLLSGDSKSCGCLRIEKLSKQNKIYINHTLNLGVGFFNNKIGQYFMFDEEDLDVINKNNWYLDSNGYAVAHNKKSEKKENDSDVIRMHRAIMSKYEDIDDKEIDHKTHNKIDSRKINLRSCNRGENTRNTIPTSNTGIKNIRYDEKSDLYIVNISINKKPYNRKFKLKSDAINYLNDFYKNHPEIEEFRYKEDEDYRHSLSSSNEIIAPFIYIGGLIPKPIIDPFIYYTNGSGRPIINPFNIVDPDKFFRQ